MQSNPLPRTIIASGAIALVLFTLLSFIGSDTQTIAATTSAREIKILSLSYIPATSSSPDSPLDLTIANNSWNEYGMSLQETRNKINQIETQAIDSLEEASCYRGYLDDSYQNQIDYNVVDSFEYIQGFPVSDRKNPYDSSSYVIDYYKIMQDNDVCDYVDDGVYEIWVWGYTGYNERFWESNFWSRVGDISNSDQYLNDLPECSHSYTVYTYNYGRTAAEALHNHGHQFERIFRYLDYDLFMNEFTGNPKQGDLPNPARCGNVHYPPNGIDDYDYDNAIPRLSDCNNWDPDDAAVITAEIDCSLWGCNQLGFMIYWMQNFPTRGNNLKYQGEWMRDWWAPIIDFELYLADGRSLTSPEPPAEQICLGDYNGDKIVGINDLSTFATNYKQAGISCNLDLVGNNCYLDVLDLSFFAGVYKDEGYCG